MVTHDIRELLQVVMWSRGQGHAGEKTEGSECFFKSASYLTARREVMCVLKERMKLSCLEFPQIS